MKRSLLLCFAMLMIQLCDAQQKHILDSLMQQLRHSKEDTNRVNVYTSLAFHLRNNQPDTSLAYALKALKLAEKINFIKGKGDAIYFIGEASRVKGQYDTALAYELRSLEIRRQIGFKRGIGDCYIAMGLAHQLKGDYDKAIDNMLKALRIREEMKDSINIAISFTGIGSTYKRKNDYNNALQYYQKAADMQERINDQKNLAGSLHNIGTMLNVQKKYEEALKYFNRALELNKKFNNKAWMSNNYISIGNVYSYLGDPDKALENYHFSAELKKQIDDKYGLCLLLGNMGSVTRDKSRKTGSRKELAEALDYIQQALKLSKEIGSKELQFSNYEELAITYADMHDFEKAYEFLQRYTDLKDTVLNEENLKNIAALQEQYNSEKKDKEIQLLNKNKELKDAELAKQQLITWSASGGLLLATVLAFFIYRGYRQKKRDNLLLEGAYHTIEEKNRIVEEKNKDITDSINYARRIQSAILPSIDTIHNALPGTFILYKPKDIVSGDFYWFAERNSKMLIAAADCTGHGVPGAFMSMIGNDLLNHIVIEKGITSPADVLNLLNDGVRAALKQDSSGVTTRDGMDIALLCFDRTAGTVEYAGANRPLWIANNTVALDPPASSINEIKADKIAVGGLQSEEKRNYTNHCFTLSSNETYYIFSDGFADQFGGENNKKFTTKRMRELLSSIQDIPVAQQHLVLDKAISEWKGINEQVDDILVIGIRI